MADITMCYGRECPLKEKCYRYTAPKGHWQSYFMEVPYKDGKCSYFWDNKEYIVNKKVKDAS